MAPFLTNQSKAFVYALVSNSPSHPLKAPRAEGSVAAARKKIASDWSQETMTCNSFNCFSILGVREMYNWRPLFRAAAI